MEYKESFNAPTSGFATTPAVAYTNGFGAALVLRNTLPDALHTAAGLTAGNVTTNANLTGPITSVGNTTSIASQTGTGTKFVVDTSPTIITPTFTTNATTPLLIGGSGTTGTQLTLKTTTGVGTTDALVVAGGNNGASTFATINALGMGIGSFAPTSTDIFGMSSSANDTRFLFTGSGVGGPYFTLNASNGTLSNRFTSLQLLSGGAAVWQIGLRGSNNLLFYDAVTGVARASIISNESAPSITMGPVAVATLPTCDAAHEGTRASVNNSNAASFTAGIGSVVAGGGTTHVPVYCDGTNWRIG